MARESQGLQVLLIVFVMLAVVLGVTTYLYNKRADEATKAAVAAVANEKLAKDATAEKQKECDELKTLIGFPERSTEDIKKQFAEDMKTYGNEKNETDTAAGGKALFDPTTLYYSRLLAGMNKVIQDRTFEVVQSRAQYADLETRFKGREAAKDAAIDTFNKSFTNVKLDVEKTVEAFKSGQQATQAESDRIAGQVKTIRTAAEQATQAAAAAADAAKKVAQAKDKDIGEMAGKLNQLTRQEMDIPSGDITWVSLPNKLVWINRGRADSLQRQTRFTVYSGESTSGAKAVKKGTVEVTQIEGDHSAQCRILDDRLADPIMAGDKVFTPLWSPGQQNHFALTGIMDLDGDGRNQLSIVRGLINQNGGMVDCEVDERGQKQGQITSNTRYLVVGAAPDKSSPEFMKNHGDILRDAERYHVQTLKLSDFKQQMGYQKSSSVEHFGAGPPPSDVRTPGKAAKASKAAPKEDSGN